MIMSVPKIYFKCKSILLTGTKAMVLQYVYYYVENNDFINVILGQGAQVTIIVYMFLHYLRNKLKKYFLLWHMSLLIALTD